MAKIKKQKLTESVGKAAQNVKASARVQGGNAIGLEVMARMDARIEMKETPQVVAAYTKLAHLKMMKSPATLYRQALRRALPQLLAEEGMTLPTHGEALAILTKIGSSD